MAPVNCFYIPENIQKGLNHFDDENHQRNNKITIIIA